MISNDIIIFVNTYFYHVTNVSKLPLKSLIAIAIAICQLLATINLLRLATEFNYFANAFGFIIDHIAEHNILRQANRI